MKLNQELRDLQNFNLNDYGNNYFSKWLFI